MEDPARPCQGACRVSCPGGGSGLGLFGWGSCAIHSSVCGAAGSSCWWVSLGCFASCSSAGSGGGGPLCACSCASLALSLGPRRCSLTWLGALVSPNYISFGAGLAFFLEGWSSQWSVLPARPGASGRLGAGRGGVSVVVLAAGCCRSLGTRRCSGQSCHGTAHGHVH